MQSLMYSSLALSLLVLPVAAQQQQPPQQWRALSESGKPDPRVVFEAMAPGWHVTTGPPVNIVNPRVTAPSAPFAVEIESFLFPGSSDGIYGVILGGENLSNTRGSYTSFLVRRDGSAAVVRRQAGADTPLISWEVADSLVTLPPTNQGPTRIVVSVNVDPDSIRLVVNGGMVGAVSRHDAPIGGALGVRVGENVNVHIGRLDVIQRYAPTASASQ